MILGDQCKWCHGTGTGGAKRCADIESLQVWDGDGRYVLDGVAWALDSWKLVKGHRTLACPSWRGVGIQIAGNYFKGLGTLACAQLHPAKEMSLTPKEHMNHRHG